MLVNIAWSQTKNGVLTSKPIGKMYKNYKSPSTPSPNERILLNNVAMLMIKTSARISIYLCE